MRLLRWLFDQETGTRIEHPVLGEAVYFKAKLGSYWEIETEVAGRRFTLIVDAENLKEPSDDQVAFFQRFANHPELAFRIAAPVLAIAYRDWTKKPLPDGWQDNLSFVGMSVPQSPSAGGSHELSFEESSGTGSGHFVVTVVSGSATKVEVSS